MTMKKILAIVLVAILTFVISIPAFAISHSPEDTQREKNVEGEDVDNTEQNPDNSLPKPEDEPPKFQVEFFHGGNGYKLMGYFPGYTPDMTYVETFYSFDMETFHPVDAIFSWDIPEDTSEVENPKALIADQIDSPLREYLAREVDSVYIRLHYKTKDGSEGTSEVYSLIRPTQPIPLPDDIWLSARYASNMQLGMRPIYQYNITVREDATLEDLNAMLPDTLPIRMQLTNSKRLLADVNIDCAVEWNLPESLEEETEVVIDGIKSVTPPTDITIDALDSLYMIDAFPEITVKLKLIINRVNTAATFELHSQEQGGEWDTLDTTFPLKPSGATAIIPYYSLDGGATWIETEDLLSYNNALEAFPRSPDYNFATLFTPEQSPFKEFTTGQLEGFLVKFNIIGGVFDGMSEINSWPMEYTYEPPDKDNGVGGSGGNENNAGSDGDDGQRPIVPEGKPIVPEGKPIVPPPIENLDLTGETVPTPAPEPKQPSLPETGDAEGKPKIEESDTAQNSGDVSKFPNTVVKKGRVDKTEKSTEIVTKTTVGKKGAEDYFGEAQIMENDTVNTKEPPTTPEQKQHDNVILQPPEREAKGETSLPKGTSGLLITGGVAVVGMTATAKGKAVAAGIFAKLISAIKCFLAH